jgi:aminoglycoside phosphotransferase (APT) family kinase protein
MTTNDANTENESTEPGSISGPQGFIVEAVMPWLEARCHWMQGPYSWERLAGGHSNLTYRVTDVAGNAFVLRRPPEGELLPSAHDMAREFTIMQALWSTPVPVAEPLAFCDDKAITGAIFYAMRAIDGKSLYSLEEVLDLVPEASRREHGFHFIDVLADLHAVDPNEVGLGDLGRPDAYVARQLKRWRASWDAAKTVEAPDVESLHEFLAQNTPEQVPARLVHGDYGLHNCVSNSAGQVAAVIDWEISTLGDALADLAYAINGWGKPGEISARGIRPSQAPGYPTDTELLARYATKTGVDLSHIGFYISFNHWKTVCILNGVLARYYAGQKSTDGVDIAGLCGARDEALVKAIDAARPLGYVPVNSGGTA